MKRSITILATLFVCACSATRAADIEGEWRLTEIAGKPVANAKSTLTFDGKTQAFSASVGCNHLFGNYRTDKDRLTLSSPATTLIGCPAEIAALENTLSDTLSSAAAYRLEQNRLQIYDHQGTLLFSAER